MSINNMFSSINKKIEGGGNDQCQFSGKYIEMVQGSSLSFQRGRSFETISGFQREVLVQILDFPIYSIYLYFSLSLGRLFLQNAF